MNDTPPEIEKRYRDMLMAKSPAERLRMASRMFDSARKLALAGIDAQSPGLAETQRRIQLFLRFYAADFTPAERERIIRHIEAYHGR
jgi:hypothetical protein